MDRKKRIIELEKKKGEIASELDKLYFDEKSDVLTSHRKFLGKCYIRHENGVDTYIKIISEYSENQFHMECFEFVLPLQIEAEVLTTMFTSRFPDGTIDCTPYQFVNEPIFCSNTDFKDWIEISNSKFMSAMEDCQKQLIQTISTIPLINADNDTHTFSMPLLKKN
jgi:hypothetical protein